LDISVFSSPKTVLFKETKKKALLNQGKKKQEEAENFIQ